MARYPFLAIGPEPGDAAAVAIVAHGRGSSPEDMGRLARALDVPGVRFLLPEAPGGNWYPERFLAPIARNEPWLSAALANQMDLIEETIAAGVPSAKIVLGGFSQGACLAAETLIRRPGRYGAALILTGGLIGPPGTTWTPDARLAGTPVYLTGSEVDPHIPVTRTRETEAVLSASGALVEARVFADRPHTVSGEELGTARAYLQRVTDTGGASRENGDVIAPAALN